MKGLIFITICLFSGSIIAQNTENIVVLGAHDSSRHLRAREGLKAATRLVFSLSRAFVAKCTS